MNFEAKQDGNWSDPLTWHNVSYTITAVDQVNKIFTVSGADAQSEISAGDPVRIQGSTGNDGIYTCGNILDNSGNSDIVVIQVIPNAIADGGLIDESIPVSSDNVSIAFTVNSSSMNWSSGTVHITGTLNWNGGIISGGSFTLDGILNAASRINITDGDFTFNVNGGLQGTVDIHGGIFNTSGTTGVYFFGGGGIFRIYSNVSLEGPADLTLGGTFEIHGRTVFNNKGFNGSPIIKLMTSTARYNDAGYYGPMNQNFSFSW